MANCVLKCAITVQTILHATLLMGIVNVCLAGLQVTAQNVSQHDFAKIKIKCLLFHWMAS